MVMARLDDFHECRNRIFPLMANFPHADYNSRAHGAFLLEAVARLLQALAARAHGMWTYKPRQGRKAATVVCSTSAVVTLAFLEFCDLAIYGFTIWNNRFIGANHQS
jgi:hypothetical protein